MQFVLISFLFTERMHLALVRFLFCSQLYTFVLITCLFTKDTQTTCSYAYHRQIGPPVCLAGSRSTTCMLLLHMRIAGIAITTYVIVRSVTHPTSTIVGVSVRCALYSDG